jgi:hypothetical protein
MSNLLNEIESIEAAAKAGRVSIKTVCEQAGVAPSNWARWKRGKASPTLSKWEKVRAVAERLSGFPTLESIFSAPLDKEKPPPDKRRRAA